MISFQLSTEDEIKQIQTAIDSLFGEKVAENIIQNKKVIIAKGKWTEIFLVSSELLEIFEKIITKKKNPYSIGLFLGELRNKKFKLSIEAVFEIANYTSHKIQLTSKGAQTFLYGRDVSFSAIDKTLYDNVSKGDYVILFDDNGFPIGMGEILHDFATIQKTPSRICIKNLIDRGWYLRKGE